MSYGIEAMLTQLLAETKKNPTFFSDKKIQVEAIEILEKKSRELALNFLEKIGGDRLVKLLEEANSELTKLTQSSTEAGTDTIKMLSSTIEIVRLIQKEITDKASKYIADQVKVTALALVRRDSLKEHSPSTGLVIGAQVQSQRQVPPPPPQVPPPPPRSLLGRVPSTVREASTEGTPSPQDLNSQTGDCFTF